MSTTMSRVVWSTKYLMHDRQTDVQVHTPQVCSSVIFSVLGNVVSFTQSFTLTHEPYRTVQYVTRFAKGSGTCIQFFKLTRHNSACTPAIASKVCEFELNCVTTHWVMHFQSCKIRCVYKTPFCKSSHIYYRQYPSCYGYQLSLVLAIVQCNTKENFKGLRWHS